MADAQEAVEFLRCGRCRHRPRQLWHRWCKECQALYNAEYYAGHSEEMKKKAIAWTMNNPQKKKQQNAGRDKERMRRNAQRWRENNRQRAKDTYNAWRKKYPHKHAEKEARRRASVRQCTPKWANRFFIEEAYDLAQRRTKMLGEKWSVDHIVPIRSKIVCGLHVENNLRVIPASSNSAKGNRRWPDMP